MELYDDLKEYLSGLKRAKELFAFLQGLDENTKNGKYEFDEDTFVNVIGSETGVKEDLVFESHRKYIDVHYLISGEERVLYSEKGNKTVKKEYDESGDYELFGIDEYQFVDYKKGQAVVFPVNQPHLPCVCIEKPQKIKKAIIKIKSKN